MNKEKRIANNGHDTRLMYRGNGCLDNASGHLTVQWDHNKIFPYQTLIRTLALAWHHHGLTQGAAHSEGGGPGV